MHICKECNIKMTGVMSFTREKRERFSRCPNCFSETKHRKIKDEELSFKEVLSKAIRNRK